MIAGTLRTSSLHSCATTASVSLPLAPTTRLACAACSSLLSVAEWSRFEAAAPATSLACFFGVSLASFPAVSALSALRAFPAAAPWPASVGGAMVRAAALRPRGGWR